MARCFLYIVGSRLNHAWHTDFLTISFLAATSGPNFGRRTRATIFLVDSVRDRTVIDPPQSIGQLHYHFSPPLTVALFINTSLKFDNREPGKNKSIRYYDDKIRGIRRKSLPFADDKFARLTCSRPCKEYVLTAIRHYVARGGRY